MVSVSKFAIRYYWNPHMTSLLSNLDISCTFCNFFVKHFPSRGDFLYVPAILVLASWCLSMRPAWEKFFNLLMWARSFRLPLKYGQFMFSYLKIENRETLFLTPQSPFAQVCNSLSLDSMLLLSNYLCALRNHVICCMLSLQNFLHVIARYLCELFLVKVFKFDRFDCSVNLALYWFFFVTSINNSVPTRETLLFLDLSRNACGCLSVFSWIENIEFPLISLSYIFINSA